jgi:hypothetical protein
MSCKTSIATFTRYTEKYKLRPTHGPHLAREPRHRQELVRGHHGQPGHLTLVRSYLAIHGLAKMEETTVTQRYQTYLNYVMQRFCHVTLHVITVISRMLHAA